MAHYSVSLEPAVLARVAATMAKRIEEVVGSETKLLLVYTGLSGVALGTAISLYLSTPPVCAYVRKRGEKSHGEEIEFSEDYLLFACDTESDRVVVFVDDFIDTGDTAFNAMEALFDHDHFHSCRGQIPVMAALSGNRNDATHGYHTIIEPLSLFDFEQAVIDRSF